MRDVLNFFLKSTSYTTSRTAKKKPLEFALSALLIGTCLSLPAYAQNAPAPAATELSSVVDQGLAARKAKDLPLAISHFEKALAIMEGGLGREHENLVPILDALGGAHRDLKQYPKALEYFQRSLAIDEKRLGAQHPDVAADLRAVADVHEKMDEHAKAVPLRQRAITIYEKAEKPDWDAIAVQYATLGLAQSRARDVPGALARYERGLALYEKVHGAESDKLVTFLNLMGNLLRDAREDAKAQPYYERSIAILRKTSGEASQLFVVTTNNLAISLQRTGHFARALALYQQSLAGREKLAGPDSALVANTLANIATLQREMGAYAQALASGQRALAIRERLHGPDHPEVATSLNNLAGLTRAMGHADAALPLYQRSLAIREKAFGPEHAEVATALNNLALLHASMGNYARALPLYERALAIREKVHGADHPEVATTLSNLGALYRSLQDYEKGVPLLSRALRIRVNRLGLTHPDTANSVTNMAVILRETGRPEQAREYYEQAVAIMEKLYGTEHINYATTLNNLALSYSRADEAERALPLLEKSLAIREKALGEGHPEVAVGLINLAQQHVDRGNSARAAPLLLRALQTTANANRPDLAWPAQNMLRKLYANDGKPDLAIFFGKQAVNTIQGMRARNVELDQTLQRSFLTDKADVYRGLADVLIGEGRLPEAQHVLLMLKEEEFFDFIRRNEKADTRGEPVAYTGGEEPWRKRYAEISSRLGSIGAELAELDRKAREGLTDAETARREQLRGDRKVAQQAFDAFLGEFVREASTASAQRNRDIGERGLTNLRALQGTLGALGHNAVTVHYLMGESRLSILLTTPSLQIARTAPIGAAALNQKVAALQGALQARGPQALTLAQELHQLLIAPIAADLEQSKAQTLMVSLDGALRYIPLAVLHDGKQFLVERYRLSLFTEAAKDKLRDAPQATWRVAALGLTEAKAGFSALPSVKGELEGIIKQGARGALPGEMHLDGAFTASRLRGALDKAYPVLHVASHFKFQPGTEANSFLLLGDGSKLTLQDLKEDDYRFHDVDLMTLSACETAVGGGRDANGMEVEGLGALAQKQGAKAVIATLWPVADDSTGILMQRFYTLRESGKLTKAEALRQAQLEFIQGKHQPGNSDVQRGLNAPAATKPVGYNHPYYWAPFILMGNWL